MKKRSDFFKISSMMASGWRNPTLIASRTNLTSDKNKNMKIIVKTIIFIFVRAIRKKNEKIISACSFNYFYFIRPLFKDFHIWFLQKFRQRILWKKISNIYKLLHNNVRLFFSRWTVWAGTELRPRNFTIYVLWSKLGSMCLAMLKMAIIFNSALHNE